MDKNKQAKVTVMRAIMRDKNLSAEVLAGLEAAPGSPKAKRAASILQGMYRSQGGPDAMGGETTQPYQPLSPTLPPIGSTGVSTVPTAPSGPMGTVRQFNLQSQGQQATPTTTPPISDTGSWKTLYNIGADFLENKIKKTLGWTGSEYKAIPADWSDTSPIVSVLGKSADKVDQINQAVKQFGGTAVLKIMQGLGLLGALNEKQFEMIYTPPSKQGKADNDINFFWERLTNQSGRTPQPQASSSIPTPSAKPAVYGPPVPPGRPETAADDQANRDGIEFTQAESNYLYQKYRNEGMSHEDAYYKVASETGHTPDHSVVSLFAEKKEDEGGGTTPSIDASKYLTPQQISDMFTKDVPGVSSEDPNVKWYADLQKSDPALAAKMKPVYDAYISGQGSSLLAMDSFMHPDKLAQFLGVDPEVIKNMPFDIITGPKLRVLRQEAEDRLGIPGMKRGLEEMEQELINRNYTHLSAEMLFKDYIRGKDRYLSKLENAIYDFDVTASSGGDPIIEQRNANYRNYLVTMHGRANQRYIGILNDSIAKEQADYTRFENLYNMFAKKLESTKEEAKTEYEENKAGATAAWQFFTQFGGDAIKGAYDVLDKRKTAKKEELDLQIKAYQAQGEHADAVAKMYANQFLERTTQAGLDKMDAELKIQQEKLKQEQENTKQAQLKTLTGGTEYEVYSPDNAKKVLYMGGTEPKTEYDSTSGKTITIAGDIPAQSLTNLKDKATAMKWGPTGVVSLMRDYLTLSSADVTEKVKNGGNPTAVVSEHREVVYDPSNEEEKTFYENSVMNATKAALGGMFSYLSSRAKDVRAAAVAKAKGGDKVTASGLKATYPNLSDDACEAIVTAIKNYGLSKKDIDGMSDSELTNIVSSAVERSLMAR